MVRWTKNKIQRFTRRDDGGMTIEFVILFPVLMIIFVSFLGFSIAFVRQPMILNHVNQVARAYSVGFSRTRRPQNKRLFNISKIFHR